MKKIICDGLADKSSLIYKFVNAFILGSIFFVLMSFAHYSTRDTSDYFMYHSLKPVTKDFGTGDITFISSLTRYQEANMRYNDTLFCGFFDNDLFWYSQSRDEYNAAPPGNYVSKWVYGGEKPTSPMICELRSASYVSLPFGIETRPQKITTEKFTVN